MDFMTLARERYSLRKFSDRKVEREKLEQILEAGQLAPTAKNLQPQRYLVLQGEEALRKLQDCTTSHFHAPLAIVVAYDKTQSAIRDDGFDYGQSDASIAATHMMLALCEMGLGATWVGAFDEKKVREAYDFDENIFLQAILVIGYPAEGAKPSAKHTDRKLLSEVTFFDSWGKA